ncbi:MAG: hypothetical protein WKF30_12285 [Pyrinomonadaceae bacterium]
MSRDGSLRILDVGCGTGANLELLGRFGAAEGGMFPKKRLSFAAGVA